MVYVLDTPLYSWDKVALVSQATIDKQIQGLPLQQSDIPSEPYMSGRFVFPDICARGDVFLCVSDRGRMILEEMAPGCIEYFPLNLKIPASMQPAKEYFFFDVLTRAQCID